MNFVVQDAVVLANFRGTPLGFKRGGPLPHALAGEGHVRWTTQQRNSVYHEQLEGHLQG
jgi:hypothetical protein